MKEGNTSKEGLLKAIERLEKNPKDRLTFLTDIGAVGVGAVGAGAAAVAFGGAAVPILFGLITIPVAAPAAIVVGGAVLGGAALLGVKRVLFDRTYQEGKRDELLRNLKERYREAEQKERRSTVTQEDKNQFCVFLKLPLELDLISPEDAQNLMELVQTGKLSLSDAYKIVGKILSEVRGLPPAKG